MSISGSRSGKTQTVSGWVYLDPGPGLLVSLAGSITACCGLDKRCAGGGGILRRVRVINKEAADQREAPFLWDLFWGNTPGFVKERLPEVSQGNNTHRSKCGKENNPTLFY